jgi:aspartate/tyrosine/aromatic aminotransferase
VKKAEEILLTELNSGKVDKEYNRIDGIPELKKLTQELIFGDEVKKSYGSEGNGEGNASGGSSSSSSSSSSGDPCIASLQTISGTGALRLTADFLSRNVGASKFGNKMFVSDPTWGLEKVCSWITDIR